MIKPAAKTVSMRAKPVAAVKDVIVAPELRPEPRGSRALDDLVFKQGLVDFLGGSDAATPETHLGRAERFSEIIRSKEQEEQSGRPRSGRGAWRGVNELFGVQPELERRGAGPVFGPETERAPALPRRASSIR